MAKNDGLRKLGMLIIATLLLITLVFKFDFTSWFSILIQRFSTPPESAELKRSYAPSDKVTTDPHDPRFYNIILEEEALMFGSCQKVKTTASVRHSNISLTGNVKKTYNIGEEIRAIVTLHDGYGKRKYSGGDQLRATIENRALDASAPCVVTDNNDGTYAVTCEALWSGTSTINVTLAYTRETITTMYRMRTQVLSTRYIGMKFKSRTYSEVTTCHPNDTRLLELTRYTDVCNLTNENSGLPFYCGKPKDKRLNCQDKQLASTTNLPPPPKFSFTECFQQNFYKTCLRNRRLYVFGDSTTRHWYESILKRFNCKQITEKWKKEKWNRNSECYNKEINFKAGWYPQAQPYFGRDLADTHSTLYSTSGRIDSIPRNISAIVIIHIYMHMVAFHHSVFKQRMETIRKCVDRFLTKNKQSIIMIKTPHTYDYTGSEIYRQNDYFGYVYSKLLYEVFKGLHDRVVLLNNRDATIAQHVKLNHPPENVINVMIDQMLSYACD